MRTTFVDKVSLTAADARMAFRVVGYREYGNALDKLDRLVRMSSSEELEAINEIISEREEFTVYSNLSGQLPAARAGGSLADRQSDDARRGLAWVTALARVEFGAILAGFTPHRAPFMFVKPTAHDFGQSIELLLDGVLTHRAAMKKDREFRDIARVGGPIKQTLAQSRRVRIVQQMLEGAMKAGTAPYSRSQLAELNRYHRDLDDVQNVLIASIQQYLATRVHQTDTQTTREVAWACGRLLKAEQRELAAGTATVRQYTEPSPSASENRGRSRSPTANRRR